MLRRKQTVQRRRHFESLESRRVLTASIEVWPAGNYEGDSGSTIFEFAVSLTAPISQPLTVDYTTAADPHSFSPAEAGSDYAAASGTLLFEPEGFTTQIVAVEVFGDTRFEFDEGFLLVCTPDDGSGDVSAGGFIANDDLFPELSIADVTVIEGDDGFFREALFTVTRTGATGDQVNFLYETSHGTADDNDYFPTAGMATMAPGETTYTISVTYFSDTVFEPDETFFVTIGAADFAFITDAQAIGTIANDDLAPPQIAISDEVVIEGDESSAVHQFRVFLDRPWHEYVQVFVNSTSGTATLGSDYLFPTQEVIFAPGETEKFVEFTVLGDTTIEGHETFTATVRGISGAPLASGTGTIVNDDFNTAPLADADGPYAVLEGGQVLLDAAGSSDAEQPAASLTYAWDFDYDGVTFDADESGSQATFSAAGLDGPASRTVAVRVTDAEGLASIDTAALVVQNAAPLAIAGADQTAVEAGLVSLVGSGSDAGPDALSYLWRLVSGTNGQSIADGNAANYSFVPGDNGVYTWELTVTDDDGAAATDVMVITVENADPTASIGGDTAGVPGQTLSFTLGAGDVSAIDAGTGFDYEIDWGDGSPLQTLSGQGATVPTEHTFASAGVHSVSVTTIDKDGGRSDAAAMNVNITPTLLVGGVLYVGGSGGNDTITVNPGAASGSVSVTVNRCGAGDVLAQRAGGGVRRRGQRCDRGSLEPHSRCLAVWRYRRRHAQLGPWQRRALRRRGERHAHLQPRPRPALRRRRGRFAQLRP